MDYNDLVSACESISIRVTEEMMLAVEEATRNQSSTRLWYVYRAGRVTASRMKQVCHTNASFYQVQTQIFICKVEYCDFCVCTFPETGPSLYTERIYPDSDFWHTCIDKATHFFRICILPEILGKWYTRPFSVPLQTNSKTGGLSEQCSPCTSTSDGGLNKKLYCYCKQPEDGVAEMIACDNPQCLIEWFHTDCLKIKHIPKGKWYCPDCRKLPQFNVVRKGKRANIV